ncbi:hypothetical protein MtrunA17_Chr7g0229991 [Medicago truncatula]|uniref:Uncharacterized protein n=1 Tax=Medicago truncatula TaxID=3880 RepID=A0A396H2L4_MEDTR|nr:hypothetical protein MtrunA17_Chr7g0229991 [Medicago truncatula]
MGIPVHISEEIISFVLRRPAEGTYKAGIKNVKTSPWNEIVHQTIFNSKEKGVYADLGMEIKMMMKIQNENLLPKGGGSDQPSLEHKIFLHLFIRHMIQQLRESQEKNRCWVPYGRLISEILYQGGILKAFSNVNFFTDEQLGTVTGKIINGGTLKNMKLISASDYKQLESDLKESHAISNLMENFSPICKKDPLDVQMNYIKDHFASTGTRISLQDVPENMYEGALPVAKSRKTKRKAISKDDYLEEAAEQTSKKAKKSQKEKASSELDVGSDMPTIQEEVQDLDAERVLNKRTRSGKEAASSQVASDQPPIPKKKRKRAIRKRRMAATASGEEEGVDVTH